MKDGFFWSDDEYAAQKLEAAMLGSEQATIRVRSMKLEAALDPPTPIAFPHFPYPHRTVAEWYRP